MGPDRRESGLLLVLEPGPVPEPEPAALAIVLARCPLREVGLRYLEFKQGEPVY